LDKADPTGLDAWDDFRQGLVDGAAWTLNNEAPPPWCAGDWLATRAVTYDGRVHGRPPSGPRRSVQNRLCETNQYKGLYVLFQLRFWTERVADSPLESKHWGGMIARMGCKGSRVQISASRPPFSGTYVSSGSCRCELGYH
jgi:hypothetical protein